MNENESKKVPEVVLAPLTGKAVPLSEVPDPSYLPRSTPPCQGRRTAPAETGRAGCPQSYTCSSHPPSDEAARFSL